MKVTPVAHGLEDLIGKSGPRTPGLHMSTIYNDMYQELEPTRYVKGSIPDTLRLEAGLAFESFLEEAFKARLKNTIRPDEMMSEEGILFNPDMIIFNGATRVGEIKLTWLSSRGVPREPTNGFPPKFGKYLCQIMSYCHCLGVADARLITFFVMGDYTYLKQTDGSSKPAGPELLAWDLQFTSRELKENWSAMINHAKHQGLL